MCSAITLPKAGLSDSKSQVRDIQRQIDGLVKLSIDDGDLKHIERAAKLSRKKEDLMKPKIFKMWRLKVGK